MSYPGNPSLPPEVQERARTTFNQTLDLVTQGRDQEALTGCEFILRLDPLFSAAQQLQQRLQSPERPVQVDDLRLPAEDAPLTIESLDELPPLDQDALPTMRMQATPPAAAPAAGAPTSGLGAVLHDLLAKENYAQVLQIATSQQQAIQADPELRAMVEIARQKMAGAPAPAAPAQAPTASDPDMLSLGGNVPELDEPLSLDEDLPPLDLDEAPLSLDDDAPLNLDAAAPGVDAALDAPLDLDGDLPSLDEDLPPLDSAPSIGLAEDNIGLAEDSIGLADEPPPAVSPDQTSERELSLADDAGSVDEEGRERIAQLIAEGDEVYQRGDFQGAIDVWSRIFLIDVTHGVASQRIEEARKKKMELERQAEEYFHQAVEHIEAKRLGEAKEALRQAVDVDPNHSVAREYLDQLEAGQVPAVVSRGDVTDPSMDADFGDAGGAAASPRRDYDRIVVVKKTDKKLIAAAVLGGVVVLGGGGFLVMNKDKLFPNTDAPAQQQAARPDPIAKAQKLYELGDINAALAVLRAMEPGEESYDKALALIAQWQAELDAKEAIEAGPSPQALARRDAVLAAARRAHEEGHLIRARRYYEHSAVKILPLGEDDKAIVEDCNRRLAELEPMIQQFNAREYTDAIPNLWLKYTETPDDPNVVLLLTDAYYNLALADLQRNQPSQAIKKLNDVIDVDPGNKDIKRLLLFAEAYTTRPLDLRYTIFVKYTPTH